MAEDRPDPDRHAESRAGDRRAQTIEPATERARRRTSDARTSELEPSAPVSTTRGDIPEALKRRYFTEEGHIATAFFAGPGAKVSAFRDHGDKLSTHHLDPAAIRDMVAIAAHRNWKALQVRGDDDFRREVWMEARAIGLEVRGYRPRQRDLQELEARLTAQTTRSIAPSARDRSPPDGPPGRDPARDAGARSSRADFDAGVRGILLETGEAPYRRRQGQPITPYVRLDRGDGRALDVWGVGLTDALARSGARPGDQVLVRRDGIDRVHKTVAVRDPATGEISRQAREVPRNRWTILAERFREASPAEAARDPELKAAQSQLAVVRTVIQATLADPASQARAYAAAKAQVADRLAAGRQFRTARVQEPAKVAERPRPFRERRQGPSGREAEKGPERTRQR